MKVRIFNVAALNLLISPVTLQEKDTCHDQIVSIVEDKAGYSDDYHCSADCFLQQKRAEG
jgi:hydroxyacyl-ACP dehydratase HTD2-like protein with hotdog domain